MEGKVWGCFIEYFSAFFSFVLFWLVFNFANFYLSGFEAHFPEHLDISYLLSIFFIIWQPIFLNFQNTVSFQPLWIVFQGKYAQIGHEWPLLQDLFLKLNRELTKLFFFFQEFFATKSTSSQCNWKMDFMMTWILIMTITK